MEIVVLQEVTDWKFPNHVYHVIRGKSKLYGYEKASTGEFIQCKKQLTLDRSRRKFQELRRYVL